MNLLEVKDLSVSLDGIHAIEDVSFSLEKGEIVGLVGPNGAGKTTLLKVLAGILRPQKGDAWISKERIRSIASRHLARKLGYLPQEWEIHWPMTVERVVALGRIPYLMPWEDLDQGDEKVIEEAMQATDIFHLKGRRVDHLAGGEKALVMIARLLAGKPEILLADEPVQGLDPSHALQIMELLRRIAGEGRGVLVVLHDLALASRFCHRILLLHQGRIMAAGTADKVLVPENLEKSYHIEVKYGAGDDFYVMPWKRISDLKSQM